MSSISSEQAFFFTSTFSGDPSDLQIIKQVAVRFEFNGSWKSCTYNYLDVNPNIARLFQERHFESYGENWMGELEAALKQNPKFIKAAYVTTSDLITKVGLEILSKIKVTLPYSQDPVVSYLGHWISHAFGKSAPPEEYRDKDADSLQESLTLSKHDPAALISEYVPAVDGRVNPNNWYGSDDISDYLELIVEKELNGYRAREQGKCRFVLQGNEQGFFKENGEEWVVVLTPPIDSFALSLPLGYFLDRELWPQETFLTCYRKIKPEIEQLAEEDPKQRYEHLCRLLSPEYREDMVERLLPKLEEMEFDPEALDGCIMSLEMEQKEDLFGELAPVLQQERTRIKILTPYNRTQDHWLTKEIQVRKELYSYQIQVLTHDPYGGGEMEEGSFKQLHTTLTKRIRAIQPEAEIKISREKSPYNRRQAAADHTSCGVIVIEDILRRISGASLTREGSYTVGAVELREAHMEKMKRFFSEGHRTRENFLKRNTLSTEPASSLVREPSLLTPPQIVDEEESLSIGISEDTQKEKIFKYVKKAGAFSSPDITELDQSLREAISHNQTFFRYQSGSIALTANFAAEAFKLLLSLHDVPSHRDVPTALLSKILDLTFYQSDLVPHEEFLREVCREVMFRVQNFVKNEALNLHREIDAAELRGELSKFFKNNPNAKQRIESLEGKLAALWKKLSTFDKRLLLSKEEMELVLQSFNFKQGKDLHELEMDYAKRLEQANLQLNYCNELEHVLHLGALHAKKQERLSLIHSAGFYNYAFCLLEDPKYLTEMAAADKEREKERIFHCLGRLEIQFLRLSEIPVGSVHKELKRAEHSFKENRRILAEKRRAVDERLAKLGEDPSTEQIIDLQGEITEHMRSFTAQLIDQCIRMLGKPPCDYAVIGLGSMAREEMTHYSDLEFAILIKEGTEQHKEYFRNLTYLLHLKVVNLGETILPALNIPCLTGEAGVGFFDTITLRGFAFDRAGVKGKGCKTPLGNGTTFELIQTPTKMAQYLGKNREGIDWLQKEPHLPMELLNFVLITGDDSLCYSYQKALDEELSQLYRGGLNLRNYLARVHLVAEDEQRFDPTLGDPDQEGQLFKVKQDLYRFPHLSIERLALLSNLQVLSTVERIKKLNHREVLNATASERLQWLICTVLFQRLKVYSHYKAQQEFMNPLIKAFLLEDHQLVQKQFTLNENALKTLTKIYQILIPLYKAIKAYLKEDSFILRTEVLYDESLFTLGQIAARLLQYEQARACYLKVQDSSLGDEAIKLLFLGAIELRLGKEQEALSHSQKSVIILEKIHGKEHPIVATSLNNIGMAYNSLGKAKEALSFFQKALAILEKIYGKEHLNVAIKLNNIGTAYHSLGKTQEALSFHQKALAIREKIYGKEHSTIANSLNNIGSAWYSLGRAREALSFHQRALTIREKIYGKEHPDVARSLSNIGVAYNSLGKAEEALSFHQKALAIREKIYGKEHPDVAESLNSIGSAYHSLGKAEEELSFHQKALAIREKIYGKEHPDVARSLNNIGTAYDSLGKAKEVLPYLQKALTIWEKIYGKEHPDVAVSLNNIGMAYHSLRKGEEALPYLQKALTIWEKIYGKEHPNIATSLNNIGSVYHSLGKPEEALPYLQKALTILEKIYGKEHPNIATSLNHIGGVYHSLGKPEEALFFYQRALAIRDTIYRKEHPHIAMSLSNIGMAYHSLGKEEEALSFHQRALKIQEKIYGKEHPHVATSLSNIGGAYESLGKAEEALSFHQRALTIREKIYGKEHRDIATSLSKIGVAYNSLGKAEEALSSHRKALTIQEKIYGKEHPHVATSLSNIGGAYYSLGKAEEALLYLQKALTISKKIYGEEHLEIARSLSNIGSVYDSLGKAEEALSLLSKSADHVGKGLRQRAPSCCQNSE